MDTMLKTKDVKEIEFNTLNDRCDRCGVAAHAIATKEDMCLLFCLHHMTQYEDALTMGDWRIEVETF